MQETRFLKKWRWGGFFLLLLVATCATAAETPLEVYGRLPSLENVALSPDGTRIAYVKKEGEERIVYIVSLADMKMLGGSKTDQSKLRDIIWADNDHVLFRTSTLDRPLELKEGKSEFSILLSYDIKTGKTRNPMNNAANEKELTMNIIGSYPMIRKIEGHTTLYVVGVYFLNESGYPGLFQIDLITGGTEIVKHGSGNNQGWLVDENGTIVAADTYNNKKRRWGLNILKDGDLVEVASGEAEIEYPTIKGFSPSGDEVWMETEENSDPAWKPISLKNGAIGEPLNEVKGFRSLSKDPYTNRIIGGHLLGQEHKFAFLDNHRQAVWEDLQRNFAGGNIDFVSASNDYQKMIILVEGPQYGYAYYLFDVATRNFLKIGDVYAGLTQIAKAYSIKYSASDGVKIPGFLTLPFKREAKNLPLVVMPHGGPAAHDDGRFDWWAQALAAQGYAVLQPNYRGSDLDWKFISAGFGEWGRKMQTDLSDGVRQLVKEGIVDPKRVSIVGASYGGYAALAGATLDVGVYRCAVSVAGLSDLHKFQVWIRQKKRGDKDTVARRYWDRFYGASGPDDPILKTLSPLELAGQVAIPILLIHGLDDTVVPFEQSKLMEDALKHAGKSVELVTLKNEDHWLSRSETRLQMLEATVKFLRDHNPPD